MKEIENELRQDTMDDNQSNHHQHHHNNVSQAKTTTQATSLNGHSADCGQTKHKPSSINGNTVNNNNNNIVHHQDKVQENTNNVFTNGCSNDVNGNVCPSSIASPMKRLKGSLKKNKNGNKVNESKSAKTTLTRRVSFDPLALLLDASLEGELDLVKKTSEQVTDPSACNDEGITALHNATCASHFDIVKYLVQIGCNVNAQDSDGW